MNRRKPRNRKAFTLVEALAAGVVLTLAGAMLADAVRQGMRSLVLSRDTQRAAELLDRTLTKIDMIGPARLAEEGLTEGTFPVPHDKFRWEAEVAHRTEGYLYDVTVRITWPTVGGGRRKVVGATRVNDPPKSRPQELEWDDL